MNTIRDSMTSPRQEIKIEPIQGWFSIDWKSWLQYRDLLFLLVKRDFVSKYRQTILGPLWIVLQPLLMTAVFIFIFAKIARVSTEGVPPLLFYLCAFIPWTYFAQCFLSVSTALIDQGPLLNKVYFPRFILPLSLVLSHFVTFAIQFSVFIVLNFFLVQGNVHYNVHFYLVPLLILQMACLGLGIGLWMASATARYRDLKYLLGFFIQIGMFATPVVYPLSVVPENWKWMLFANPVSVPVEAFRYVFFSVGSLSLPGVIYSVGVTWFILLGGLIVFNRVEKTFVDTM